MEFILTAHKVKVQISFQVEHKRIGLKLAQKLSPLYLYHFNTNSITGTSTGGS